MNNLMYSLLLPASVFLLQAGANAQSDALKLTPYKSEPGRFSIQLPSKPEETEVAFAGSKDKQLQISSGTPQGVYMVSWQDSQKLAESSQQRQIEALKLARNSMMKSFKGELIKEEVVSIGPQQIQTLRFQISLPEGRGQMLGLFFFANAKMYQVMAIGTEDFVRSQQTTQVLKSFRLTRQP